MPKKRKLKRGKFGRILKEKLTRRTVPTRNKKTGKFTGRRVAKKGERSKRLKVRRESRAGRILGLSY